MTTGNLKVLAIDEAALDASVFDKNMYTMLGCATGAKQNTPEAVKIINAKNYILNSYIPSWINASNEPNDETGYFITEGRGLKKKLDEIGVPNDLVFFPGAKLPHGYMDKMDAEPHAKEAFDSMMSFIKKRADIVSLAVWPYTHFNEHRANDPLGHSLPNFRLAARTIEFTIVLAIR